MKKTIVKAERVVESKETLSMAFQVSDRVQLDHVRIMECSGKLIEFPKDGVNDFEITAKTRVHSIPEDKLLFVFVEMVLYATMEEGDDLAKITSEFLLAYDLEDWDGLTEEHLNRFAEHNGVFNAWPYWRELVQSMTSRLQLPPLTLGTHRFGFVLPTERTIHKKKKKVTAKKAAQKKLAPKKTAKKKAAKKKTTKKKATK